MAPPHVPAPDVDPSRAYLALSQIGPPVSKPQKPASLKPLSERSVKQIAAARVLIGEQRYTEAAIELERGLRYDPNHPEIHRTLGALHWEAGNAERAETHTRRALDINPDDAGAHRIIGRCGTLRGDNAAAIIAYRTALACSGLDDNPEIATLCHYHLAEGLAAEEYLEAALEQYLAFEARAASLGKPVTEPELVTILHTTGGSAGEAKSRILERLGRFADAAEALRPAASTPPGERTHSERYARLLMRAGKLDRALTAARAIASTDNGVIELLGEIHERAGHPEGMVDDLRARMERRPGEPRLAVALADVLIRLGRPGEARRELHSFVDRYPDATGVRKRLVDVAIAQGAWQDALHASAEGVLRHPDRAVDIETSFVSLAANDEALTQLLEVRAKEQENEAAAYLRGVLALAAGRLDDAEDWLRTSLSHKAAFVPARAALAGLYLRTYRYEKAIQIAGRADENVAQDAGLERILGQVYERLDDLEQAELHFKAAMQLNRADVESMFAIAEIYRRSRRPLQAQRQLRVLLEEDPLHEPAREALAFMYLQEGKIDAAFEQFEQLRRVAATPITKARCAALLDQFPPRDGEVYRKGLIEAVKQHGPDTATWTAIAQSYDEFADTEEVREAYLNALALDPDNEEASFGLVRVEQRLLDFEGAIRRLTDLLPRRPNRHSWRRRLIDLYQAVQDYDAAIELARDQEARDDLDETARRHYRRRIIDILSRAGRTEEALQQLKTWSDADPHEWEWAARLASAYIQEDQAPKAIPILTAHFEANPDDHVALGALVETLAAVGQVDRASQYALDWLFQDPDNDDALALLVSALGGGDRLDDALELIRNRLLHTLNRQRFQNRAILLFSRAGRHTESVDFIETLLDHVLEAMQSTAEQNHRPPPDGPGEDRIVHRPDEPSSLLTLHDRMTELRLNLALELIESREYRDAEEKLTTWLEISRDPSTRFRYLRALTVCYQQQGQEKLAGAALERTLLLEPDDVALNNDLAYGWIDRGVRLDEAESMIRYAVWRAPLQGAYLDTYGWLRYKKGEFEEARKWLERAARALNRQDPVVLDHLGDVCWRLGLTEEAVEHWQAAVEAVSDLSEDELVGSDVRRVRSTTQLKIEEARTGNAPEVAPLAPPPDTDNDGSDTSLNESG